MESVVAKVKELDWWEAYEQVKELLQERRTQYALVGGVVVALVAKRLLSSSKYNLPPGPRGLPLLGNMIGCRNMSNMEKNFDKWRKQYGDVFTIHLGPVPFIILASTPAIREAFITKGNDFAGRFAQPSFESFSMGFRDIIFAQPTPVWKMQRQIAHSALRKYASGHLLEDNLQSCMDAFVEFMDEHPDKVVDIPEVILRLTYNFLATLCYGRQFGMHDPWVTNFIQMMKDVVDAFGAGIISDFFPSLKFLDTAKLATIDRLAKSFFEMVDKELEEHEKTFDASCPRDFTDELLLQRQKQEESGESKSVLNQLTKSHLIQTLSDIFFAGTDTSRITLSMLIAYMAEHPEIQAKLHKELDDVLGEDGKVTLKLKDQLSYTNAVVHETMRYSTVVPVGVPHQTTCDTTLGEYSIPKGMYVIAYTHGVHRDPANYPDPDTFKPERWLDSNGKFQYKPYIFMPFSMGPRVCVGESLARADLQLFTAMLFHKYEFTALEDNFKLPLLDILPLGKETAPFKLKLTARH